ncbi:MAG: hypothetical protein H7124_13485 [Phycisphaerales bacterium]|nr:hypothetical protein [Hyphomonadaceae bacterium]
MNRVLDPVARLCVRWAVAIMPPAQSVWANAMAAEFEAVHAGGDRLRFALGCLSFAVSGWARSRQGLVWIGRGAIAAGLWAMSAIGAYVATGLDHAPGLILFAACGVYSIGGAIALCSLRALQSYAILVGSCVGLHLLATTGWFTRSYQAALALEAGALMAVLLVAATLLMQAARDA